MKQYIFLVILVGLLFTGCSQENEEFIDDVVVVGAVLPLSGPGAFLGQQFQRGLELASAQINDENNIYEIVYEDSKADPREAISAYQKLKSIDNPDILISAFSAPSLALIPLVESDGLPMITSIVSSSQFAQKSDMAFRYFTNADIEAPVMARYAIESNFSRFAVIYINDDYGVDYYSRFAETIAELGGTVVTTENYLRADGDFRNQLLKFKNSDAQAIYVIGYDEHMLNILNQIVELGIDKQVFTNWLLASPNNAKAAGDSARGVIFTTPNYYLDTSSQKQLFESGFLETYGEQADAYAALGYDVGLMLGDIISRSQNRDELLANLQNLRIQTLMGEISVEADGEMSFGLIPATYEDGVLIALD